MDLSKTLQQVQQEARDRVWRPEPELLLCPNIPKPMHGMAPRVVLGKTWWDKERKAAFKLTNDHCAACGVPKRMAEARQWLEGHEIYRIDYLKGLMTYDRTVGLCHFCHNFIHDGRLQSLLAQGKINHGKFARIIQHGHTVLERAGLEVPDAYDGPIADWGKWYLVIGKKKYKGLFSSYQEWRDYHREDNAED